MTPPRWSRRLLEILTRADLRDALLDDLDEAFARQVAARGRARARRWYRRQCVRSVPSLMALRRQSIASSDAPGLLARIRVATGPAIRHAFRRLRATPGFTTAAVATLGLALAANLATFALVDAVLIHPLPYADADRLVDVGHWTPGLGQARAGQAHGGWTFYRRENRTFTSMAVYNQNMVNLTGGGVAAERVNISMVSPDFFPTLGVAPLHGRVWGGDDEGPHAPLVVVLSYQLWTRRYGGDPAIVGQAIEVNGLPRQVAAVMPAGFAFPTPDVELWMREGFDPNETRFGDLAYGSVGRLKPGVTVAQAEADLNALASRLPEQFSDVRQWSRNGAPLRARVEPLKAVVVGDMSRSLLVALGAAALMLILSGANVANLFLIRSERRLRDTGICRALGASPWALFLTNLAESSLVAAGGGAFAAVLVPAALRLLSVRAAQFLPRVDETHLGARSWIWLGLLMVSASLVLAAVAHWRSRHARAHDVGRGLSASRSRVAMRHTLAAVQVALALALLVGAGLLGRSFWNLITEPLGFESARIETFETDLPFRGYSKFADVARFYQTMLERVRALPGVEAAGAVSDLPLSGYTIKRYLNSDVVIDRPGQSPDEVRGVRWKLATPGYFETVRIPIVRGHWFSPGDRFDASIIPIVVSQSFARRLGGDAIGRRLHHVDDPRWCTVVGIVGNVRDDDVRSDMSDAVYVPVLDQTFSNPFNPSTMQVAIRVSGRPEAIVPDIRAIVSSIDSKVPVADVQTLDAIVARARARDAFIASLVGMTAALAVLVGMVGLYATFAYTVSLRRHELSIRVALGATIARLAADVARPALVLVGAGLLCGGLMAWLASRAIGSLLFGVGTHDGLTFVLAAVLVGGVSLVAIAGSLRRLRFVNAVQALQPE